MATRSERKKKRNLWPYIAGGILLVGAGGGYGIYQHQVRQTEKANKQAVQTFVKELNEKKYDSLPTLLPKDIKKRSGFTSSEIVEKYKNIYGSIEAGNLKISDLTLQKEDSKNYSFSYKLEMTTALGKTDQLSYKGKLINEDGKAKVDWRPELVFPGMKQKDKVSFSVDLASRGKILDRNGQELATTGKLKQLGVVPSKLGTGAEKEQHIKEIAETYSLEETAIDAAISQSWVQPDYFVPLTMLNEEDSDKTLPAGTAIQEVDGRYYPLKEAAAQLVGYVGTITAEDLKKNPELSSDGIIGRTGLERTYDKELRGKNGGTIAVVDENGTKRSVVQENKKKDGQDIQLTIDAVAQQVAYNSLGGKAGATVATQPKTGDLLAVVSSPSYDPNKMSNGLSQEEYDAYEKDPLKPFLSRFATGYAPGSTFKTITAAIGLDNGTIDPAKQIPISGLKWQKDSSWGSYEVTRVSDTPQDDLRTALVYSDNIYMAQETLAMGEKAFREGLDKFIFGENLDVPIAMDPAQISNEKSFHSEILLADTGYGQGQLLINPIQQAAMYSVFANNGNLVYPKLLKGAEMKTKEAVIQPSAVQTIVPDLEQVVTDPNGTAHSLAAMNLPLAAKTGTAEIKEKQDEKGKENSFLFAFDSSQQKYLVVSMLEDRTEDDSATKRSEELLSRLNTMN